MRRLAVAALAPAVAGLLTAAAFGAVVTLDAGASGIGGTGMGGSGALVRGNAPLPSVHLDFLGDLAAPALDLQGAAVDLNIAVSTPDNGVFSMLFSPRPQFGLVSEASTGTNRSYAGLTWTLFDSGALHGAFALSGSLTQPGITDPTPRQFGPPQALHSTIELGYALSSQHSLTLSFDRATVPDMLNQRGEYDNVSLRFGLHF